MSEESVLTEKLRQKANQLKIDRIGFIAAESMEEFSGMDVNWDDWGRMKSPYHYLSDARSIIVVAEVGFGPTIDLAVRRKDRWNYIGYKPLEVDTWKIGGYLQSLGYRVSVLPSHLSQKNMARLAGMGSFGKSTLILNSEAGPYMRIDSIVTDARLEYDKPQEIDLCGDCQLCLEACPSGALKPYQIDVHKCLVHQRLHGPDGRRYADMLQEYSPQIAQDAYIMCQECQLVCPAGGRAPWERE